MVRGKKGKDVDVSPDLIITGHVDDWADLAVDYVDDRLEPAHKAAVQAHLDECPECAARLAAQSRATALLAESPLVDPPADLESRVLGQVLHEAVPARSTRPFFPRRSTRSTSGRRPALSPAGPWLPALAGAAAVVVLVLALTISRGPDSLDETVATVAAEFASEEGLAQTAADANAEDVDTTARVAPASGAETTVTTQPTVVAGAAEGPTTFASLRPVGPYLQDESDMASALAEASTTAFFFFDPTDGVPISDEKASSVTSSFTSATGLGLVDGTLSSGVEAFAAFVPRDNSDALVSLLCTIADSQKLSVCLSLEPGSEVEAWAASMLQDRYALPELSASLGTDSRWSYTTSTASPSTSVRATTTSLGAATTTTLAKVTTTKSTSSDETDPSVLVVIFMAGQDQSE